MWRKGNKLIHPFNPELGVGMVEKVEGRFLTVHFPATGQELRLAAEASGLTPLVAAPGARGHLISSGEQVEITGRSGHLYRLADGREIEDEDFWPEVAPDTPLEQLASLQLDRARAFRNRLDGLRFQALREAGGLGSFLGGRIELFPHQLHTALSAVRGDPVRWLLADEVGLGKTIEACLMLSALLRTGRAERALVIAPGTLTVQWLGELYRKFHQIFALLDAERLDAVAEVYEADANPFEVHPFGVMALELLASDHRLAGLALEAEHDLIVVDEAHRLADPDIRDTIAPLVRRAKHALLLTATPLHADPRGFYELLSMLRPDAFEDFAAFEATLSRGEASLACTSSVRREDIGGLPPRRPQRVDLRPTNQGDANDPRTNWLAEQTPGWAARNQKALVFVHGRERLESLRGFLERTIGTRIAVFHEGLSAARRDLEVANFRESKFPLLLCSEAGSEGRNFQFCDRMVHYDLPTDPVVLEQRIGRLDRIGRRTPVEIIYFGVPGTEPDLATLYERLELFSLPSAGLDQALAGVRRAIESALASGAELDLDELAAQVARERERGAQAFTRVFYPDAYDRSRDEQILALVPEGLEVLCRRFVTGAARELGLRVVEKGQVATCYIEFGAQATVDSLPGVPGGSRYLGSFDREEAIRRDELDFFASGHALTEGLLLELEDGPRGRAALLELSAAGVRGDGLLLLHKHGSDWSATAIAATGEVRPDWSEPLLGALADARDGDAHTLELDADWPDRLRALAALHATEGELVAAAWFRSERPAA